MRTRYLYAPQVALPRGASGLVFERTYEGALRLGEGCEGSALAATGLACAPCEPAQRSSSDPV